MLYGCENLSLTQGKERICRVSECRLPRRIFVPKWEEITLTWRRLRKEELNYLYFSTNIIWVLKSRRIGWAGNVARMGERIGVHRVLVGIL